MAVVNDSRSFNEPFSLKVLEPDGGKAHHYTYSRSKYGSHDFVEHEAAPDDIMVSGDDSEDEDELLTKAQRLEKKRHEGLTAVEAAKVARGSHCAAQQVQRLSRRMEAKKAAGVYFCSFLLLLSIFVTCCNFFFLQLLSAFSHIFWLTFATFFSHHFVRCQAARASSIRWDHGLCHWHAKVRSCPSKNRTRYYIVQGQAHCPKQERERKTVAWHHFQRRVLWHRATRRQAPP